MELLHVSLLGRFTVHGQGVERAPFGVQKVQELFSYLLIFRQSPHHREFLADLLWEDVSSAQSRQYFRKTLWQLQSQLDKVAPGAELVSVQDDWVQINDQACYWLDLAELEEIYHQVFELSTCDIHAPQIQTISSVVALYQGELLQGWYQDWCLGERERCHHMYLVLLDKLMEWCLVHGEFARGIDYGEQILRSDAARERTYRQIMTMYALSGDRTSALRQFQRCAAVLDKELGVMPAAMTLALYEQIRSGSYPADGSEAASQALVTGVASGQLVKKLHEVSLFLTEVQSTLDTLQTQVAVQRQTLNATMHPTSASAPHSRAVDHAVDNNGMQT